MKMDIINIILIVIAAGIFFKIFRAGRQASETLKQLKEKENEVDCMSCPKKQDYTNEELLTYFNKD